jgi:transketolase
MDHYLRQSDGDLERLALTIRRHVVHMTHQAGSSHVGSSLSMVELLVVLYRDVLRVRASEPRWAERDRFILSKGHACAALYAVLAECGFFPLDWLDTFYQNGAMLAGHATHGKVPGVEISTGSLGHGLPVAAGMALAAKRDGLGHRVFAMLSDGECDEGSTWEAALFAPQHHLDNLVAIVDYNKIQSLGSVREVMDLEPLAAKWRDFGWAVREVDGHDVAAIRGALTAVPFDAGRPSFLVAHTVKGKGVSFMEGKLLWHYRSPQGAEYEAAMAELGVTGEAAASEL